MDLVPPEFSILEKFDFERSPVGVKFLAAPEPDIPTERPVSPLDFCEMLVEAQQGKAFSVTKEDFTCLGPLLLGMVENDPVFESGGVGVGLGVFKEARANRKVYQHIHKLPLNSVDRVAFAPIQKLAFKPDLMIILASASQAEILIRANSYASGDVWSAIGTPVIGCSWLYIYPFITGKINFTVTGFGFGMKSRRLFPEGRILLSIPMPALSGILKNLSDMEWVPESFSLGAEGHKKKVRRIVEEIRKTL